NSPNNVQTRLQDLQEDLSNLTRLRDTTALRVQGLRQSLADTPTSIPTVITGKNPEFDRIDANRRQVRARLAECLNVMKMTDKHPDVIALQQALLGLDAEAANLEQEVVTAKEMTTNPKRAE